MIPRTQHDSSEVTAQISRQQRQAAFRSWTQVVAAVPYGPIPTTYYFHGVHPTPFWTWDHCRAAVLKEMPLPGAELAAGPPD